MLYLLSSPIGNFKDISSRLIDTLNEIDLLYCEDTRVSEQLLHFLQIKKPLHRYDEHVEQTLIPKIVDALRVGQKIGFMSDAGVPTVSDPGYKLVRACIKEKISVINIPGPSAILTALVQSGLPTDHFMFFGFLPKSENHVKKALEKAQRINAVQKSTFVFFESPHRLLKTLKLIADFSPHAQLAVCRELTKLHEEIVRGQAGEIVDLLSTGRNIRGEITLVVYFD